MTKKPFPSNIDPNRFEQRIGVLRNSLQLADPFLLADRTAASYQALEKGGEFQFLFWKRPVSLSYPDWVAHFSEAGKNVSAMDQALLLYYFNTADGTPISGNWISFSELPDGRFYNQAFQGYTGAQMARALQNDQQSFERSAESLAGARQLLGQASFSFYVLPRVVLLAVYWQGDEDFSASCQILFDSSASHYLPTEAYAILGSSLTRRLLAAKA